MYYIRTKEKKMATVPQPYEYPIASIPGGEFDSGDRLLALIQDQIPVGINPVINSDGINITVEFDEDLEDTDKATLDSLIPHAADYYIITIDGGNTDEGDPAEIVTESGLLSAVAVTLQMKAGDGSDIVGFGEGVTLGPPIMTISTLQGNFNGSGQFTFTVGAVLDRGRAEIEIQSDFSDKELSITWT